MKRDNENQPQNGMGSMTLNNKTASIRNAEINVEKGVLKDARKMIPKLPKIESINTSKGKNNSSKNHNSDRANSVSVRSDSSQKSGIIEKLEFYIDENKNIISSPRLNTEKTSIKKVKYSSVERQGKTYNINNYPKNIINPNEIEKKNYLKKLSTIVRFEDPLEIRRLNYTKEYFSVIKNNLLGNFQIRKEGKLINKSVETLEEINNPFKLQKQSPRDLKRKLTIIRDKSYSILYGINDYLNNQSSNIFLTMAFMSGKGIYREDKLFERGKRVEKGGVVDFLYKTKKIPQKHQIKGTSSKFLNKVSTVNFNRKVSAKEKEKAAKRIQSWWRRILVCYKEFTRKLIKVQSYWRGHWIRSNQYDLLYYSLITYSFVEKLNKFILNFNYRRGLDTLIDKYGDKYKERMYVLKFVKIQREVKKFLKKKGKKIVNKSNFSQCLILMINRKTFKFLKSYYEHRQSIIFRNINFLLRIKKLMRKNVFSFIKNPGKIRKRIKSSYEYSEFENRIKKKNLKLFNLFFRRWFKKVVEMKKKDNFVKEISCIVKYREPSKKQREIVKIEDGFFLAIKILKSLYLKDILLNLVESMSQMKKGERRKRLNLLVEKKNNLENTMKKKCFSRFVYGKYIVMKGKLFNRFVKTRSKEIENTLLTKWFRFWFNSSFMISDQDEDEFMTDSILLNTNFGEIIYPKRYIRKSTNINSSTDSLIGEAKGLPNLRFFKQISFKFKTPLKKWSFFLEDIFRILEPSTTQLAFEPIVKIKGTKSESFLKKLVSNKILPILLKKDKKEVKNCISLWKNRLREKELQRIKAVSFKFLYNRLKNKFNNIILREKLREWLKKKKKIIRSNKIANSVGLIEIVNDDNRINNQGHSYELTNTTDSNKILKNKRNSSNNIDSDSSYENEHPRKFIKSSYLKAVLEKNISDMYRSCSKPCFKSFFKRLKLLDKVRIALNHFLKTKITLNVNEIKRLYLRKWFRNNKVSVKQRNFLEKLFHSKCIKQIKFGFKRFKIIIDTSIADRKRNNFLKIFSGYNKLKLLFMSIFYNNVRLKYTNLTRTRTFIIRFLALKEIKTVKNYFTLWRAKYLSSVTNHLKALQIKCLSRIYNLKIQSKAFQKFKELKLRKLTSLPQLNYGLIRLECLLKSNCFIILKEKLREIVLNTLPKPKMNKIYPKFLVFNRIMLKPFFNIIGKTRDRQLFQNKLNKRIGYYESLYFISISRYLEKWKSVILLAKENEIKKKIKTMLIKNMYRTFHKSRSVLNYFRYWKKIIYPNLGSKLYIVAQKISKYTLLNNYKKNLKNTFRSWIGRIFNFQSKDGFYIKYRLLKRLISHKTDKLKEMSKLLVFIRLLKWKLIHNSMIEEKSHNIRFGLVMLRQIVKRKHIKFFKVKLRKKFDTNKRNLLLYKVMEKSHKKFFNLNKFFSKWKQFYLFNNDIDASFLKCKSLEINFDRPTSSILEKLKGKYLRGNDTLMQRNPNKHDIIQAKINFEAGKKYLKTFFLILRSQYRHKVSMKYNKWKLLSIYNSLNTKAGIIQKYLRIKLINLKIRNQKKYKKNDVMLLELKPRLSIIDRLKSIFIRIPFLIKRNYYTKWKKEYYTKNENKKLLANQAYLRNLHYLKLIVKLKGFVSHISKKKYEHIDAYFRRWFRTGINENTNKSSLIIQRYIYTKLKRSKDRKRNNIIRSIYLIYVKNTKESFLKNHFTMFIKRLVLIKMFFNARIIQHFINAKILKRILKRKEVHKRIDYINDLLIKLINNNESKQCCNYFRKILLKWIKINESGKLNRTQLSIKLYSLFREYMIYTVKKSFVINNMLDKLHNGIKRRYVEDRFKAMKDYSGEIFIQQQAKKNEKANNMLNKLAYYLTKKLFIKTEAIFRVWKNLSFNDSVDKYARVLQRYFKSISNAVNIQREKEANKKIIKKKGMILSQRVAIIVANLLYEKEKRDLLSKHLTYFGLWKIIGSKGKILKSKLIRTNNNQVNSLLSSIFHTYSNNIYSILSIYKASWFSKITQIKLNLESHKIQNYCKKQVYCRKLSRSHDMFNRFSLQIPSKELKKFLLFSKMFRTNFSIEKIGKKALISCLKSNLSISIIENINDILKKLIRKMRKRFIKELSSFSKSSRFKITIGTIIRRRIFKYIIYWSKSTVLTSNIYLISKEILMKKLVYFSKLLKTFNIINRIYCKKYLEMVSKCVLIHKYKLFSLVKKLYENSITKQLNNLNIFTKLVYTSNIINKYFKKKYFPKLFSPVTTLFNKLFHIKYQAFQKKCTKQLKGLLKVSLRKRINESQTIKYVITETFNCLIIQRNIKRFKTFFNTYIWKILTESVKKVSLFNKFLKTLTNTFIKKHYSSTVIRQVYLNRLSYFLNSLYKRMKFESSVGFKSVINTYVKQFLYFRNLIVDKHKEIYVSPIFIKLMSFKLQKRHFINMINFFKYNVLHRVYSNLTKSYVFKQISMFKFIPSLDIFVISLSNKLLNDETLKFSSAFKVLSFQKKIVHILFKYVLKDIINAYKDKQSIVSAFNLLSLKLRSINLKGIIDDYIVFKDKRGKDLRKVMSLRRCLSGIILKNVIIHLKYNKQKSLEMSKMMRFIEKLKKTIFIDISKIIKEIQILNLYKRRISAFEGKIRKTLLENMIKNSIILNQLNEKWSFKLNRLKLMIKRVLLHNIHKMLITKEESKLKAISYISLLIERIKNASNYFTIYTLFLNNQTHIKRLDNLYVFFFRLKNTLTKHILRHLRDSEERSEMMRNKISFFTKTLKKIVCDEVFHSVYQTRNKMQEIENTLSRLITTINNRLYIIPFKNRLLHSFIEWRGYKYVLSRMINKKADNERILYSQALIKWRMKTIIIGSNHGARKIQIYLMKRLLRMKNKVFEKKQFQIELRNRGFLKLASIVRKLPFREAWRKILCERKRRMLISFLLLLKSKKRSYLKRFMLHFKKTFKIKNEKYNKAVEKVIRTYRSRKFRKNILKLLNRIRMIGALITKKKIKLESQLNIAMNNWCRNINLTRYINSVRFVQYYLRNKLYNLSIIGHNKILSLRLIFKDYICLRHIKPYFKQFLSKHMIIKGFKFLYRYMFKKLIMNINLHDKIVIESNVELNSEIDNVEDLTGEHLK